MRIEEFTAWKAAYDHFNAELFAGRLPQVMFEYTNKKSCRGFAGMERYADRNGETSHVIAMNATLLLQRELVDTLSTLVHEMTHVEQFDEGTQGRGGYHNARWAALMKRVGLHPSSNGQPGGKETGNKVTHYIVEGGAFAQSADRLLNSGWMIQFAQCTAGSKAKKGATRAAFTCPCCKARAWAQDGERLLFCGCIGEPVQMVSNAAQAVSLPELKLAA